MGLLNNLIKGSSEKNIQKNDIKTILSILDPKKPHTKVNEKVLAVEFLGDVTDEDIRHAKPKIESHNQIITRLISALNCRDKAVRIAAANSLIKIINRSESGEKITFYNEDHLLVIAIALDKNGDNRAEKIYNKALKIIRTKLNDNNYEKTRFREYERIKKISDYENSLYESIKEINRDIVLDFIIEILKNCSDNIYSSDLFEILRDKIEQGSIGFWNIVILEEVFDEYVNDLVLYCIDCKNPRPLYSDFCPHCENTIKKVYNIENYLNDKKNLQKEGIYNLICKFVSKFNGDIDLNSLVKLKSLLKAKNVDLNYNELLFFVYNEIKALEYSEFKMKLKYNNPLTLNDYLNNFLGLYGYLDNIETLDEKTNLEFLIKILNENNYVIDENDVLKRLKKRKYDNDKFKIENELNDFERTLMGEVKSEFISFADINELNGYDFEKFLILLFEEMGYIVSHTSISRDQGADLIIEKFGEKTAVQAKRYQDTVGNKAIQEVVASIAQYDVDKGMVITNSEFTKSALELAHSNKIELINGRDLEGLLKIHKIEKNELDF